VPSTCSTYFAKDLIKDLGQYSNVPVDVLLRIAQLNLDQKGAADKGTRGAYFAGKRVIVRRSAAVLRVGSISWGSRQGLGREQEVSRHSQTS
jgi:hypothetical protein